MNHDEIVQRQKTLSALRKKNHELSERMAEMVVKYQALLAHQFDTLQAFNSTTPQPFDQTKRGLKKRIAELEARMAEWTTELNAANAHLEEALQERKQAEEALKIIEQARQADQVNIELHHRLNEQSEKERNAIGRDLHDGPIQTLASAIFDIQVLKEALADEQIDPQRQIELEQIRVKIKSTIQELRDMVNDLRPAALTHFGLSKMIGMHFQDIHDKHPELAVDIQLEDDRGKLTEDTCLALYRVYQEALNNILQHAEATKAAVRLSFEDEVVLLEIGDNGKGMETIPDLIRQTTNGHYGLAGMKERVEAAGGEFHVQSYPGKGTTIRVKIPINSP